MSKKKKPKQPTVLFRVGVLDKNLKSTNERNSTKFFFFLIIVIISHIVKILINFNQELPNKIKIIKKI